MRKFIRNYRIYISTLLFALGIILTIFGSTWVFFKNITLIYNIIQPIGDWNWWLLILGVFLDIIAGFYFYDTLRIHIKFKKLVTTKSKVEFKKNLKEIEKLASSLHDKKRKLVAEKRKDFGI